MSASPAFVAPPVSTHRAVGAELVRWKRSSVALAPLLGLAVASLQAVVFLSAGTAHGWASALAWNVIWVTGLAVPATGLIVGLVAARDQRARDGGTRWRNVSSLTSSVARFSVISGSVVAMNVLAVLPVLAVGSVLIGGPPPVGRTLTTALIVSLGCVAIVPLLDLVARRFGLFATLGFAVVWSVAGTLCAESANWGALPFAWPVRAVLPLLGTHANGIALTQADPIATESPFPALTLTFVLLIINVTVLALVRTFGRPPRGRPRAKSTSNVAPSSAVRLSAIPTPAITALNNSQPSVLYPHILSLRRTSLPWMFAAAVALELFALVVWNDPDYSAVLFELVLLPISASLLPILAWSVVSPAWRGLATRSTSPRRLGAAFSVTLTIGIIALSVVSGTIELASGSTPGHVALMLIVAVTLGIALMSVHLWLTVRFSAGLALGVLCLGQLFSLVVGGSPLAASLWAFGPWAWVATASEDPLRAAAVTLGAVGTIALLHPLIFRAQQQYAAQS